jgi:signal transduction histidine kinase
VRYGRAWGAVAQLVLDLLLAVVYIVVIVIAVVGVALTPAAGIGLVLIALAALAAFGIAYFERARLASFVGVDVDTPPPPADSRSFWRRYVFNGRPWKSLLYLFLISIWGMLAGTVVLVATSVALAAALLPTYWWGLPGHVVHLPWGTQLTGDWLWWLTLSGWVALMLVIPLISALLARVDVGLVRFLLGAGQSEQVDQLTHRVATLTETRERTVDSVELERRRIERDLHDGPQQRLVAIAMDLGMARSKLASDPETAQTLIDKAHSSAKEAITEMRQVARGIHPPVLTDRGLDAALSALAARSPVPVAVEVNLPERPSPTLEAIAYFCVSEALTNVAKHSRASTAGVRVWRDPHALVVTVSDNGAGGARVGAGTGLIGLENRVGAVDGRLTVDSPPGGPTVLTVWLPWTPARPQPGPATGVSASMPPPQTQPQPTQAQPTQAQPTQAQPTQPTQQIDRSVQ